MQVFISWSGNQSQELASVLYSWLPNVMQAVKPWMSSKNIDKGAQWLHHLTKELQQAKIAIVCVTPDSVKAPWLLFEAGAASKALDSNLVCTLRLNIDRKDIDGPLSQFQDTAADEEDIRKLVKTINKELEEPLTDTLLEKSFVRCWPELKGEIDRISSMPASVVRARPQEDLLSELITRTRAIERQLQDNRSIGGFWIEDELATASPKLALAVAKEQFNSLFQKMYTAQHDRRHTFNDYRSPHREPQATQEELRAKVEEAKTRYFALRDELKYCENEVLSLVQAIRMHWKGCYYELSDAKHELNRPD